MKSLTNTTPIQTDQHEQVLPKRITEWQELAGDRLGWRKMLKSIKIRT
jgi:hypothetical protein